jgi:hypothetical protein
MSQNELIKCVCGKQFPVNYSKHPNRKVVYCPFSGHSFKQRVTDDAWVPNASWWKERLGKVSKPFTLESMRKVMAGLFTGKASLKDEVGKPKDFKEDKAFVTKGNFKPRLNIQPPQPEVAVGTENIEKHRKHREQLMH